MKRTLVLLITAIFILAACGNHKDDQAGKDNQKHNNSSNQVKEIATDKMYKVITIVHCYHLKARQEDFYKITWQIVIMAATLKMVC